MLLGAPYPSRATLPRTAANSLHHASDPIAVSRRRDILIRRYLVWLIALTLLLPAGLAAQQNASVQGTVVDEQKGAMPGAAVTATEINTGRQSTVVTGVDGRYRFENLAPGKYKVQIELQGF